MCTTSRNNFNFQIRVSILHWASLMGQPLLRKGCPTRLEWSRAALIDVIMITIEFDNQIATIYTCADDFVAYYIRI